MKNYVIPALLVCFVIGGIAVLTLYNNQPKYKKVLYSVEQVTRQHYDSQGNKLGEPQHFKRSIYRRQIAWGNDTDPMSETQTENN